MLNCQLKQLRHLRKISISITENLMNCGEVKLTTCCDGPTRKQVDVIIVGMKRAVSVVVILGGAGVGFALGVFGWLGFYYMLIMAPNKTPFKYIDQGALPTIFTGPVGAFIGARIAGLMLSRFVKPEEIKD